MHADDPQRIAARGPFTRELWRTGLPILLAVGVFALFVSGYFVIERSGFLHRVSAPKTKAIYALRDRVGSTISLEDIFEKSGANRVCLIHPGDHISTYVDRSLLKAANVKLDLEADYDFDAWLVAEIFSNHAKISKVSVADIYIGAGTTVCSETLDKWITVESCSFCAKGYALKFVHKWNIHGG